MSTSVCVHIFSVCACLCVGVGVCACVRDGAITEKCIHY